MQTTGKRDGDKPSFFEQVGFSNFSKFNAKTEEEYLTKLKGMNLSDLHTHAVKLGVRPNSDRKRMEKVLVQEFRKAKSRVEAARMPSLRNEEKEQKILNFHKNKQF